MYTYTQILYQVVFHTKYNEPTLLESRCKNLYSYIAKVVKNKGCHAFKIGGIEDHIHIILRLSPSISLGNLIKDIKLSTASMIIKDKLMPNFRGWQRGYGAFTYSEDALNNLITYVENQKKHHDSQNSKEELIELLNKSKVIFDEKKLCDLDTYCNNLLDS